VSPIPDYASILRNVGLPILRQQTGSFQCNVVLERWTGQSGSGTPQYDDYIVLEAIVEYKQTQRRTTAGSEQVSRAELTITYPIPPMVPSNSERVEPVDQKDRITLPDGTTSPIIDVEGVADPTTGRPFYTIIFLGELEDNQ
jgi:hypothetical protein